MADQSGSHDRFAYCDRESDIVWIPTGSLGDISGEWTAWGVLARNTATGAVVSIEISAASEKLPKEILEALPEPDVPDDPE